MLNDKNVARATELLDKFGLVSLVLSRFLPVLNIPSFIAGVKSMNYGRFIVFNIFSAILWCCILLSMGYFIGNIAQIEEYLDVVTDIFIVITGVIIIYVVVSFVRDYRRSENKVRP